MNVELNRQTSVEIEFKNRDDFSKINETLTRIGVCSTDQSEEKILYQTCHILHKKGRYFILHFKELLKLDGVLHGTINETDISDRNFIAHFLESIGLCKVLSDIIYREKPGHLKILKNIQKKDYILKSKYTFKKRQQHDRTRIF